MAEKWILAGANRNIAAYHGRTPLYLAAFNGNSRLFELLVVDETNINKPAYQGWIPLHAAAENVNIVQQILDRETKVNAVDQARRTHLALTVGLLAR